MAAMVIFTMATMSLAYAGDTASDTIGATLEMGNSAPTVDSVEVQNSGTYDPTSGTTTAIAARMTVSDGNGWIDVDTASSGCTVKKGAVTVNLGSCAKISNSSATTAVFECTGDMEYYYATGADWAVNCTAVDNAAESDSDATQTLTYTRLESVNVVATSVAWTGITTASTEVGAVDDPVSTANLGNANFAKLNLTAADLQGVTTPTDIIAASDFSVNDADAANGETLSNGVGVTVADVALPAGSGSSDDFYLYLEQISSPVSVQSYTSSAPWQVTVYEASN
jgi:hypothetical protein